MFGFGGFRQRRFHNGRWQTPFAYKLIGYQHSVRLLGCATTCYISVILSDSEESVMVESAFLCPKLVLSIRFLRQRPCYFKTLHYLCIRFRAMIELWCNGNTADFGSVVPSSNLGSSTRLQSDWIAGFFIPVASNIQPAICDLRIFIIILQVKVNAKTTHKNHNIWQWRLNWHT